MYVVLTRQALERDIAAINGIYNYYVQIATCTFQTDPETPEGRKAWLEAQGQNYPIIVAEIDGEVVGALTARLLEPVTGSTDGRFKEETRLRIDYLATAAASRRAGIGTRLVQAAESWGRRVGATIAETTAFRGSALSIPFWEDRMGYEELPMSLVKRLDEATSAA